MLRYEKGFKAIAMYYDELNKSTSSKSITCIKAIGVTLFDTIGRISFLILAPFDHLEQSFINFFDCKIEQGINHLSTAFTLSFGFFGNIFFIPIKLPYLLYKNIKDPANARPIEIDTKNILKGITFVGSGPLFDSIVERASSALYVA